MSKTDKVIRIVSKYDPTRDHGNTKLHIMIQFAIEATKGTKNQLSLYLLLQEMKNSELHKEISWENYIDECKNPNWD